jgi:carbonic anhydrase/acetyltransferase-like protein (isoleucine patch superfamily)
MIHAFEDYVPVVDPSAFVHEAAVVIGDVEIGSGSSVWPGAVVRADFAPIRIGANTHVEDNATLHCGAPGLELGSEVTVGHNAVIHCRRVGDRTLIGNHATLLDGVEIGSDCVVAAGAVVRPNTKVPDGSFVAGVPATVRRMPAELQANTTSWNRPYVDLIRRYKSGDHGAR